MSGAIYAKEARVDILSSQFSDNKALDGDAIYCDLSIMSNVWEATILRMRMWSAISAMSCARANQP